MMPNSKNEVKNMKKLYMVFELNEETFGIDIGKVTEIAEIETMVRTGLDELNVIWWNERSLPVIDPVRMISFKSSQPKQTSKVIVQSYNENTYGILVDQIDGVVEIDNEEIEEPYLTAPQYIYGMFQEIKLLKRNAFLTKKVSELFPQIDELNLEHLSVGERVHKEKLYGQDKIVEDIKTVSLNWLVKASKMQTVDETLFKEVVTLHGLAAQLK